MQSLHASNEIPNLRGLKVKVVFIGSSSTGFVDQVASDQRDVVFVDGAKPLQQCFPLTIGIFAALSII